MRRRVRLLMVVVVEAGLGLGEVADRVDNKEMELAGVVEQASKKEHRRAPTLVGFVGVGEAADWVHGKEHRCAPMLVGLVGAGEVADRVSS